jgi:hypothetical protein
MWISPTTQSRKVPLPPLKFPATKNFSSPFFDVLLIFFVFFLSFYHKTFPSPLRVFLGRGKRKLLRLSPAALEIKLMWCDALGLSSLVRLAQKKAKCLDGRETKHTKIGTLKAFLLSQFTFLLLICCKTKEREERKKSAGKRARANEKIKASFKPFSRKKSSKISEKQAIETTDWSRVSVWTRWKADGECEIIYSRRRAQNETVMIWIPFWWGIHVHGFWLQNCFRVERSAKEF